MQCVRISLYVTDAQMDGISNVLSKTFSPSHAEEWLIYPIFMYMEYLPLWKESMLSSAECTERFVYEEPPCVDSAFWPGLNQLISLMSNRNALVLTRKEMSKWNMQVSTEGRLLLCSVRKAATAYSKDDVPWTWCKWLQERTFSLRDVQISSSFSRWVKLEFYQTFTLITLKLLWKQDLLILLFKKNSWFG